MHLDLPSLKKENRRGPAAHNGAVIGFGAVSAVASCDHAYDLVLVHRKAGWTAWLDPLTMDGLIYASSMVLLDSSRRKAVVPALARRLPGLSIGRRWRPMWRTV